MARLVPEHGQVAGQAQQQQPAFEPAQLAVGAQCVDQAAGEDHQRYVQAYQLARNPQRNDQCGQAEHYQHIEDIAADHAADRYIRRALVGRLQADGQLWCGAAEGDQAQADDQRAHVQALRQAQGGAHQQFGAAYQQQQGCAQLQQAEGGKGGQVENGRTPVASVAKPLYPHPRCAATQHADFFGGGA